MSHFDTILSFLGIKGVFVNPSYPDEIIGEFKGEKCFIQHAIQRGHLAQCPYCHKPGIKYGHKTSYIKMSTYLHLTYWIFLKKQRYQCKQCNKTYFSATNLVDKNCYISNPLKHDLIQDVKNKISITDIAKRNHVSWPTVQRQINKWSKLTSRNFTSLPEVLCIDEFRATSTLKDSKMALSLVDGVNHKIIDICPDRKLGFLLKHFGQYSERVRQNVKYVCTDMYEPFLSLSRKLFPMAKICIDKFHVVQLAARALNACRIEVMKKITDKVTYKTFKRFWRIPLTSSYKLDEFKTVWVPYLQTYKEQQYLLEIILSEDDVLRETYEVYQRLLRSFAMNDRRLFEEILKTDPDTVHSQMAITLATYRRLRKYIINGIESGYTNGPMEANNNNIKVLKRIAYGYRNYDNFRNRILLVFTDTIQFAA